MEAEKPKLPKFITILELSARTGLKLSWIQRAISERRMPGVYKLGHRTLLVNVDKVTPWLESMEIPTNERKNENV